MQEDKRTYGHRLFLSILELWLRYWEHKWITTSLPREIEEKEEEEEELVGSIVYMLCSNLAADSFCDENELGIFHIPII